MKRASSLLTLVFALALTCPAQIQQLTIAAGTPEDNALQAALNETDSTKRIALLEDFVLKFASNPIAAAYGNLQLAQQYQGAGDLKKATAAAEKAYAAVPNGLDVLVSAASIAQNAKDNGKAVMYATKGAELVNSITKQPKPEGNDEQSWATQLANQRTAANENYEFLEGAAYNAIAQEKDPKARFGYVEQFNAAFPKSRYAETVQQYGMLALLEMGDLTRLNEYGEKALAADPKNLSTLVMLASAFAEEQGTAHAAKALDYGKRAVELSNADLPGADAKNVQAAGAAHAAMGWVLMKQEKTPAAIAELQAAAKQLKGRDDNAYAMVLYRLGYAYAKLGKLPEAKSTLTELLALNSPYQAAGRDLMQKVSSAKPTTARAK